MLQLIYYFLLISAGCEGFALVGQCNIWGTHNDHNQIENGVQLCWWRFRNKLKRS